MAGVWNESLWYWHTESTLNMLGVATVPVILVHWAYTQHAGCDTGPRDTGALSLHTPHYGFLEQLLTMAELIMRTHMKL